MSAVLERLHGRLIVSVQAEANSPLNAPDAIALLARVAVANGAGGIRAEGLARLGTVCRAVDVPVIGLVKRAYPGFDPYITPSRREIAEVAAAGAAVAAFDATARPRPGGASVQDAIAAIHAAGMLAMADCSSADDARRAAAAGAEIVGTTLCGYTGETRGMTLPALDVRPGVRGDRRLRDRGRRHREPGRRARRVRRGRICGRRGDRDHQRGRAGAALRGGRDTERPSACIR